MNVQSHYTPLGRDFISLFFFVSPDPEQSIEANIYSISDAWKSEWIIFWYFIKYLLSNIKMISVGK